MSRFARKQRVFFVEEPVWDAPTPSLKIVQAQPTLWVVTPQLPDGLDLSQAESIQRQLLNGLIADREIRDYVLWYYTPMALGFTWHLRPRGIVYDCMDELSAFKNAPPQLHEREAELMKKASLVFTGGVSLYEAKRDQHPHVYALPSSVDVAHFAQARHAPPEPPDQAALPQPRLGFFGVIDERMNLELLAGIAEARPDWQLVLVGPTAKVNPADLPRRANIHYLGKKSYEELPAYLAGWDVALLPFARNEATQFISPTKTPEYLAGGKPVVSTSIRDVVRPYGELGLVQIADTVPEFVNAIAAALDGQAHGLNWLAQVDQYLAKLSWERTWARMDQLIQNQVNAARMIPPLQQGAHYAPWNKALRGTPRSIPPLVTSGIEE